MTISHGDPYWAQIADVLREEIKSGRYGPGGQLPTQSALSERFGVSANTVRSAIAVLSTEGWLESRQGSGVFVREGRPLRRLDTDVSNDEGFYYMLRRAGLEPATTTTVSEQPADAEVAEELGVPEGTTVVVRHRVMRAKGMKTLMLATSYFPPDVVEVAPQVADPKAHGLPTWLRDAYGPTYSEDLIVPRSVTEEEAADLEVEPAAPVLDVKGWTRNQDHRAIHFIRIVVSDRMPFGYRYGAVPSE